MKWLRRWFNPHPIFWAFVVSALMWVPIIFTVRWLVLALLPE